MDLAKAAAYSDKTPYDLWQEAEGIPIVRGHCVEDLVSIPVASWKRTGILGRLLISSDRVARAARMCARFLPGAKANRNAISLSS